MQPTDGPSVRPERTPAAADETIETGRLPDDAYTPLPPGTVYHPVVPAHVVLPESTPRSVLWGLLFCVRSVASAYSPQRSPVIARRGSRLESWPASLARIYAGAHTSRLIITVIVAFRSVVAAIFNLTRVTSLALTRILCDVFSAPPGALGVCLPDPATRIRARDPGRILNPSTAITEVLVHREGGRPSRLLLSVTASQLLRFLRPTCNVWKKIFDSLLPGGRALAERARSRAIHAELVHPRPG